MKALHKILALSSGDRALLVDAILCVLAARFAVWTLPARRLLAKPPVAPLPRLSPERIGWAIQAAARRLPYSTCLVRALAGHHLLARHGYVSELHVGVVNREGFQAHAWLEYDGVTLLGATPEQYVPLFPKDGARNACRMRVGQSSVSRTVEQDAVR